MIKKKALRALVLLLSVPLILAGCGTNPVTEAPAALTSTITASPAPPQTTAPTSVVPFMPPVVKPATPVISPQPGTIVGSPFLPGAVLAGLPVYPGAVATTDLDPGFGPPSFPTDMSIYGTRRPGYQSASAQYTVQATVNDILGWYIAELEAKGYRHPGEDGAGNGTVTERSIAFFLPSQPLVSVQVHVYTSPGDSLPVFELLAIYTVPLPRPSAEKLPDDISSVKITWAPETTGETVKTVTAAQTVDSLVDRVNDLSVRPDYITTGPPVGFSRQTLFSLIFHSKTQGDITVTDVTYEGVHFGNYPLLDDPHNLLQETVRQMAGIPGTSG